MRYSRCFILLALSSSTLLATDQVTLKNGDRLSGSVVKSDGKTLLLHTDAAGDVTIQFDSISEIKTDQQEHVELKGGKTAVGPVSTSNGNLEVATTSGTIEASPADLKVMRNEAEQTAYEKSLHPGLMHGWNGGVNLGFSLAHGNSETENLAVGFTAVHPTEHDKITMYATAIYTTNQLADPSTVANLEQGGIRYDHDLTRRLFAFVAADFMADALQGLNLRSVGSVGLGFHAIKNDRTVLDFLFGGNFTDENYTETLPIVFPPTTQKVIHNFGGLTLGEEFDRKLGKTTVLTETLGLFPNLTDTGQYRGTFNLGTVTKINKWLGWQNQFGDIYVSNPPMGTKKNDVLFTTGLNISFTH